MPVADYIAQYGKCARGTALLTSFDKLRSQKIISRNPTRRKVDQPCSSRKPTICVPFTVLRGPRVFGYFDHNCRWTSAIRQSCHFHRGDPLNADRLASSTVDIRQHTHTDRPSSKHVPDIPVSTWRNRLQRLLKTPPIAAPALLLVVETTPLVGHDNDWWKIIPVVESRYLGILPSSGKPCILL